MVMYALAAMLLPLAMAGSIGYQQMQSGMPMQQGWGNSGWGNSGWGNQGYGKDVLVCVPRTDAVEKVYIYVSSVPPSVLSCHPLPPYSPFRVSRRQHNAMRFFML